MTELQAKLLDAARTEWVSGKHAALIMAVNAETSDRGSKRNFQRESSMPTLKVETRAAFKERLQAEGKWDAFLADRKALRAQNIPEKKLREMLGPKYGGVQRFKDGETGSEVTLPETPVDAAPTIETPAPEKPEDGGVEAVQLTLAMFADRQTVDARKCAEFVFEHMEVSDVTPAMAPSAGAWSLLQMCRNYPSFKVEFYKSIWPKLLPTKSQMDLQNQFTDDGRSATELIDKMKQQLATEVSQ